MEMLLKARELWGLIEDIEVTFKYDENTRAFLATQERRTKLWTCSFKVYLITN